MNYLNLKVRKPKKIGEKTTLRVKNNLVIISRELCCFKISINGKDFYIRDDASTKEIAREILKKVN